MPRTGNPALPESRAGGPVDSRFPPLYETNPDVCCAINAIRLAATRSGALSSIARSFRRHLENHLKPEILFGRPVKWLPVTDPQGIQRRIGSKLRAGRLAYSRTPRMAR